MKSIASEFHLKCAFCCELNVFEKSEIYIVAEKGEKLREKFCIHCGEPLIIKCANCANTFSLRENLDKFPLFRVSESFWDPKTSKVDIYIPEIQQKLENYENLAKEMREQDFLLHQLKFIENLPILNQKLEDFEQIFELMIQHPSLSQLMKDATKIQKMIKKVKEEIFDVLANLDSNTKAVNEKKAKQLKKHIIFLDFISDVNNYLLAALDIRKEEIQQEKDALKPGFEKIIDHIKYDPSFYRIICPICNETTYYIHKSVYLWDKNSQKLNFSEKLPVISEDSTKNQSNTRMVSLNVKITIVTTQNYEITGQLKFVLGDQQQEFIGRNTLRDIDFLEPESESLLFDEKDPLGWVSRKQFSLTHSGPNIILKGMEYDQRRVGTYLNDFSNDIRKNFPEGISIKTGDKILVPLINEPENPNKIEIEVIVD